MAKSIPAAGYFPGGLPYNRFGRGPLPLVVFQGLLFENKPQPGPGAAFFNGYSFLEADYTVFVVMRKPGLPAGYTLKDMADDYAAMIREEFGRPVDVIGVSTGGSIAQHFAADHPHLVRRLVIHSSAYRLCEESRELQLRIGRLAHQKKWREAYAALFHFMYAWGAETTLLSGSLVWLLSLLAAAFGAPEDSSDLEVTIAAEDRFNFKDRLAQISAPTLVAAGEKDPFYPLDLFRETAQGIPNARFALYAGTGHPASGKKFNQDVLAFLREGRAEFAQKPSA